jgi:hypothetical protein
VAAAPLPSSAKSLWRRKLALELQAFPEHDFRGCFKVWYPHEEQYVASGGYYINVIISPVKCTI